MIQCQYIKVTGGALIEINSISYTTAPGGSTLNILVENSLGTPVGVIAGDYIIADNTISINGAVVLYAAAETAFDIDVFDSAGNPIGALNMSDEFIISDTITTLNGVAIVGTKAGGVKSIIVQTDEVIPVQVGTTLIDNATNLTIEVPVGGGVGAVNVSNSDNTFTVNTSVDLELADITHTDSDGSTSSLPAQEGFVATQCPTLVDGIVTIDDEDGNVLHTVNVANGGSVTQEIANSNITNSTGTFNDTVLAEGSKTLADITHTDSDGTSVVVSAQTSFVASICPVIVLPYGYTRPLNYQTTTTYSNGDDGANNINNIDTYVFNHLTEQCPILDKNNFLNMISVNSFGNNYRFTSRDGGYYDESDGTYRTVDGTLTTFDEEFKDGNDPIVFAPYIVDNYTGVGYIGKVLGAATFIQTISTFLPGYNSIGNNRYLGYTDYKIPSLAEACSIRDNTTSGARVARSSFGFIADSPYFDLIGTIMTATVNPRSTTQNYNVLDRSIVVGSTARTSAAAQVNLCRYHFPI
jgi:hypothetical protein